MIRLGIVDFDTSHVVQFTKRLNHVDIPEEQWVEGAKIVMGYQGTSRITPQEKIDEYTAQVKAMGVELVDRPEEMIGKVDGILVESQEGAVHLERARPFLEAGMPCYIDKPFATSVADAKAIVALANKNNVPVFSSSSLRYALEIQKLQEEGVGTIFGVDAYSPAGLHDRNPGLFHYGIHGVETLYALMGPGCESVTCTFTEGSEVTTGLWKDGRIGVMRGTRAGSHSYGFVAWTDKGVRQVSIDAGYIYRELLKRIVQMFQTGKSPLDNAETIEIVAFQVAALQSAQKGGERVALDL
ncbi:MAG TPA: Gfo/Idh/MocA family oxidoreductase [Armatimonadetes bacterium]|jgi:virulence factor|nr:Gfo/Idh/MocA family oxidoreductase [Armatimonadota bacterium]